MTPHHGSHIMDADFAEKVMAHHAKMVSDLDRLSAAISLAAPDGWVSRRDELRDWIEQVLVPHAEEEERTTYRAAAKLPEGRLLIESMVAEHALIRRLAALFGHAEDASAAEAHGRGLFETFQSHQHKENELILPLLVHSDDHPR